MEYGDRGREAAPTDGAEAAPTDGAGAAPTDGAGAAPTGAAAGNGGTLSGYVRARERVGPVPTRARAVQGVGALPDVFLNFAVRTFLLLYYNQVLGLPAFYVSAALAVALVVDAVTDPLMGSWSDNFRSRLGRRHPFMYASALPLGVCLYLLFMPPDIAPGPAREPLLLAWLTFFIIGARVAMTLFLVPWSAMFAEYTDDYRERSTIVSYRFLMAWIGGIAFSVGVYTWVFPSTPEYPLGQLNPAGYGAFALVLALSTVAAVLFTTHFSRDQIPYLNQLLGPPQRFRFGNLVHDVKHAVGNRDFMILLASVLASSIVIGTSQALEIYLRTYFWGLGTAGLRWLSLSFTGAVLAFASVAPLQSRFDKKHLLVGGAAALAIQGMLLVGLRLIDVLPSNGDPWLLVLLVADSVLTVYLATVVLVMFFSMVADVLDVQELNTGLRQEGLFSSAVGFSSKATSGFGLLAAGALLDTVIGFPSHAGAVPVAPDVVFRLGVVSGVAVPLLNVAWMAIVLKYGVTRERHEAVRSQLAARRAHSNTAHPN